MSNSKFGTILGIAVVAILASAWFFASALAKSDGRGFKMFTVDHEGHLYVVTKSANGVSTVHHPACSCNQAK